MLIVFSGLPGTGKSTIARALAHEIGAVWLRIDSIEQAIRESSGYSGTMDEAGYRAAYAVAADNLRLGRSVIADCVNGWMLTRDAWRDTGVRAGVAVLELEIVCSNLDEHRLRVETRPDDVPGLVVPTWDKTIRHDYHPWTRAHDVIDTAGRTVDDCVADIRLLAGRGTLPL